MAKVIGFLFVFIVLIISGLLLSRSSIQRKKLRQCSVISEDGGISELIQLDVNHTKQFVLIEGKSTDNPIILFLHGGPGQPMPFGVSSRGAYPDITDHFTAVYYDQRGSGKSYNASIPVESMNIEQFIEDTNQVVNYLTERFGQNKIYLAGMSWGSIIGLKYAEKYPVNIKAYFGLSQFINNAESQRHAAKWLQQIVDKNADQSLIKDLSSFGEAPFSLENEEKYSRYVSKYGGDNYSDKKISKVKILGYLKPVLTSPDYTMGDIYKVLVSGAKFSLFTAKYLQKEIQYEVDLRTIKQVNTSVYLFQGRHDKITSYELAAEFSDRLIVQGVKELTTLEKSAHYPNVDDFKIIISKMINVSKESTR